VAIFAFIDASGNPVPEERDPFVVTAVLARESLLSSFDRSINKLVAARLGKSRGNVEIHAKDLVQNKDKFRGIPIEERSALLADLIEAACQYAGKGHLAAISVVVEKDRFKPKDRSERQSYSRSLASEAYKLLFERVIGFLDELGTRQYLIVIVDETDLSSDIMVILEKELLQGTYTSNLKAARRVIIPPLFTQSQRYRLLQLADVIAYITRRVESGKRDPAHGKFPLKTLYNKIYDCILRKSKQTEKVEGYGLKRWKYIHRKHTKLVQL